MTNEEYLQQLYPTQNAMQVLGMIAKDPSWLDNEDCSIDVEDFLSNYHRVIYGGIVNLYKQGLKTIDDVTVGEFLKSYNASWYDMFKLYNENNDYIGTISQLADEGSFKFYYNRFKKFALLRDLFTKGFDISYVYDVTQTRQDVNGAFEQMTCDDIMNVFAEVYLGLKMKWNKKRKNGYNFQAGSGLMELKERLKLTPSYGYPFSSPTMTTITRGMRMKKLMIRSGSSGSGKTRTSVSESVNVSIPFIFDLEKMLWVANGVGEPVLFITTELEKEEIQTIMLAYLSGVDEEKILDGSYTREEEDRLDKAIKLLELSNLYVEYIADFSPSEIETMIETYIVKHNVRYIFFDYLHTTPSMLQEISNQTGGIKLREDQVLFLFSNALKQMCNHYEIFLMTGTQLNRNFKEEANLDETALRGAMSLKDKIDIGIIMTPVNPMELEKLETLGLVKQGFGDKAIPNICQTVFKNRGTKYDDLRIWVHLDLGTMRETVICITDKSFKPVSLEIVKIDVPQIPGVEAWLERLNRVA